MFEGFEEGIIDSFDPKRKDGTLNGRDRNRRVFVFYPDGQEIIVNKLKRPELSLNLIQGRIPKVGDSILYYCQETSSGHFLFAKPWTFLDWYISALEFIAGIKPAILYRYVRINPEKPDIKKVRWTGIDPRNYVPDTSVPQPGWFEQLVEDHWQKCEQIVIRNKN